MDLLSRLAGNKSIDIIFGCRFGKMVAVDSMYRFLDDLQHRHWTTTK
jgi:hypothetical protein